MQADPAKVENVMVTIDQVTTAYRNFKKFRKLASNSNSFLLYRKFLGEDEKSLFTNELPHEVQRKIEWLSGPNAETMYKIWKLQNDGSETGTSESKQAKAGAD